MPQEIPLEASDTLAFTPDCLSEMENPPVFHLRAVTHRDKRHLARVLREESVVSHSDAAVRSVILQELERYSDPENCARGTELLKAYWDAADQFAEELRDDPDAEMNFASDDLVVVNDLLANLHRASRRLSRMKADNDEARDMRPLIFILVAVAKVENLNAKMSFEGGYMDMESVYAIRDALTDCGEEHGADYPLQPYIELFKACSERFALNKVTEKNSASRSPSPTAPKNSKTPDSNASADGKSPASKKSSKKTPPAS